MGAPKPSLMLAAVVAASISALSFGTSSKGLAAPILAEFNVTVSGFAAGATDDPLSASFSFVFDNAHRGDFQDIQAESVSLTIGGFAFDTTNTAVDYTVDETGSLSKVIFGGIVDPFGNERFATNPNDPTDFLIQLADTADRNLLDGSAGRQFMQYHPAGAEGVFHVGNFGSFRSGQIGTTASSKPVTSP